MTRILVHVEGQTEEEFVNQCLGPHLLPLGKFVEAKFIGNARQRGGICSWHDAKRDIRNHLLQDSRIFATLMVDFYALPQEGHKAWPGRKESNALTFQNKGDFVENALCTEIVNLFDSNFDVQRFVPFVMMHEFEGLLFSTGAFSTA